MKDGIIRIARLLSTAYSVAFKTQIRPMPRLASVFDFPAFPAASALCAYLSGTAGNSSCGNPDVRRGGWQEAAFRPIPPRTQSFRPPSGAEFAGHHPDGQSLPPDARKSFPNHCACVRSPIAHARQTSSSHTIRASQAAFHLPLSARQPYRRADTPDAVRSP